MSDSKYSVGDLVLFNKYFGQFGKIITIFRLNFTEDFLYKIENNEDLYEEKSLTLIEDLFE